MKTLSGKSLRNATFSNQKYVVPLVIEFYLKLIQERPHSSMVSITSYSGEGREFKPCVPASEVLVVLNYSHWFGQHTQSCFCMCKPARVR